MNRTPNIISIGCIALALCSASTTFAGPVDLADTPLYLTVGSVAPNLIVTLDTSGSMYAASVPDAADSSHANRWFKSAAGNPMYYNPNTTYLPPYKYDGSTATTSFTTAYINGFVQARGNVNLSTAYRPTREYGPESTTQTFASHNANDVRCNASRCQINYGVGGTANWQNTSDTTSCSSNSTCQSRVTPAYYYVRDTSNSSCTATDLKDDDCYDIKIVSNTSGPGNTDERQNFATWYSFYRTRTLALMTSADLAFWTLPSDIRVAWQNLNTCTSFSGTSCTGVSGTNYPNYIKAFNGTHRDNFFKWVFDMDSASGTPLRMAVQRAGEYYRTSSGTNNPYAENPQVSLGTEHSCRKNFHLLMTDGEWNNIGTPGETGLTSRGNLDGTAQTLPDGTVFSAGTRPYTDNYSGSLADHIFYYWMTDLRTGLANDVPEKYVDKSGTNPYWDPRNDPAKWQHMVTYTVGLGLSANLVATTTNPGWGGSTYAGDYSLIADGTKSWPSQSSTAGKIYDLWHGAINSRGQFYSSESPADITNAFSSILGAVTDTGGSAAGLASNSTSIQPNNTSVYQAKVDSTVWMGKLLLLPVLAGGSIGNAQWDAGTLIPAHGSRQIFTRNGTNTGTEGKIFLNCSDLGSAQQALLALPDPKTSDTKSALDDCNDRIAWIRGDHSLEKLTTASTNYFRKRNITTFKDESDIDSDGNRTENITRDWVLGDIINSDPAYAKNRDFGYGSSTAMLESGSYDAYVTSNANRTAAVYVGANDGMLHAFRADPTDTNSGKELFAYVPAGVYGNLSKLTDINYIHKYYVDGSPSIGDAYFGSPTATWRTVLVGGLNAGGKTIYALDITSPTTFSASNALWEFADADDLGYTFSQPQIARLNNGKWAAIFGNGYNSTNEQAYLFIVDLSDGTLIRKIPAGTAGSNGMSTPVAYDGNNDKITDYVYAGDLQGNLWKFDLTSTDHNAWGVANGGAAIFVASNAKPTAHLQAITAQPQIGAHPDGGVMVYFGTGRYLTTGDTTDNNVQTFYGIWDKDSTTVSRSSLIEQTIDVQTTYDAYSVRVTSSNNVDYGSGTVRGWYMDLSYPSTATTSLERVVSSALVKYERIIFNTVLPSTNPCSPGGDTWLMELDALTGKRTSDSVFDLSNDGTFSALIGGLPASGVKSTVGIAKTPIWLEDSGTPGTAFKIMSGTGGGVQSIKNKSPYTTTPKVRRVYWMQIQ